MKLEIQEFNWTQKPIIGLALSLKGGEIDSQGNKLIGDKMYAVGKHKKTGKVFIMEQGAFENKYQLT